MHTPIAQVIAGIFQPYNFDTLTIDTTAGGIPLTAAKYKPSNDQSSGNTARSAARVMFSVETNPIRYTYDGTTPTSSVGHLLNAGDVVVLVGDDAIKNFRAIAVSSSGTIQVTYER